jgi:hypothetical protein
MHFKGAGDKIFLVFEGETPFPKSSAGPPFRYDQVGPSLDLPVMGPVGRFPFKKCGVGSTPLLGDEINVTG